MLELLTGKIGLLAIAGLAIAALFATAAWENAQIARRMSEAQAQARANERATCDAQWNAEIEKSNTEAERKRAEQAQAAAEAETQAASEIADLRQNLNDMETKNAALPRGDRCGVDRERLRLLK